MAGQGCIRQLDGCKYEGEWSYSRFHGKGVYSDSSMVYHGEFVKGCKHGRGRVKFFSDGRTSNYIDALDDYCWSAGDTMDCSFKCDKRHGECTYTFFNGETFSCTWVDGRCPAFSARQRLVLASTDPQCSSVAKALRKMHVEVHF